MLLSLKVTWNQFSSPASGSTPEAEVDVGVPWPGTRNTPSEVATPHDLPNESSVHSQPSDQTRLTSTPGELQLFTAHKFDAVQVAEATRKVSEQSLEVQQLPDAFEMHFDPQATWPLGHWQ